MKKFLSLLLALTLVFALVACSSEEDTSSEGDTSIPTQTESTESTESIESTDTTDTQTSETNTNESSSDTETSSNSTSTPTKPDQTTSESCDTLGHNYTEKRTESTCTQKGSITKTCTRCGKSSTESLALKSHSYTKNHVALNGTHHNDVYTCSVCGHSYSQTDPHSWSVWKTTKQPTQTAAGEQARFCGLCNYVERVTIPQLPSTQENLTEVFNLINAERQKAGLSPLAYYYAGQSAADIRANEIIEHFSHTRPNGTSCFTALDEADIHYWAAGENIAKGQTSPEEVMEDWMNSDGHRSNILNANFTHVIVGYKNDAWVQLFIGI